MADYFYRTEDIRPDSVADYFVETKQDRKIVDALKNRNATILVGSRGVGKSLLLRVAQQELLSELDEGRVFPVYISFVRSSLLYTSDPQQFKHWMLSRICANVIRALRKQGLLTKITPSAAIISGSTHVDDNHETMIEKVAVAYEESWKNPKKDIDTSAILDVDDLKDALEDLADELSLDRFVLLIDEAAHIFSAENQRQFFTLFRDLRTHCITCNAAVYPGVTSFGDTFQSAHDATTVKIERDPLSEKYIENMREIVARQANATTLKNIAKNGQNFSILAYAASGNPRLLLKTIAQASKLNSSQVNEVIREYYRTDMWAEHSALAEKYSGHKMVVDWGRDFLENTVLPTIQNRNDQAMPLDKETSAYFWIHRDAPESVNEALRILSYTGLVAEMGSGIKATRKNIGTRYEVNLGSLFALESTPTRTSFNIAQNLSIKRMSEFGANHSAYSELVEHVATIPIAPNNFPLEEQLDKSIDYIDVTDFQMRKLKELELLTIKDVLQASESVLRGAFYVGEVRARQMRNAATAAVLEYLSG